MKKQVSVFNILESIAHCQSHHCAFHHRHLPSTSTVGVIESFFMGDKRAIWVLLFDLSLKLDI